MKNDWLTTISFERMHEVISAVNVLSIHAKLTMAGVEDPTKHSEIQKARARMLAFLDRFQELLQNAEKDCSGAIIRSDPRMGRLAQYYLSQKRHLSDKTSVYDISFDQLKELIGADDVESLRSLVMYLRDLRSLIEQHTYADVVDLLGDM